MRANAQINLRMNSYKLETDFIQLNNLLKLMDIVASGGEAKMVIREGMVSVNGKTEMQIRKKLVKGDKVEFEGQHIEIV